MKNRIRNFEIQNKLGSGSYGVIYKAIDKSTRQTCVLKQISLGRLSEKARKNAVNQATIMGKLIHPFVVRYRESFIEENTLNIVMEFCQSGDLCNFLKQQNRRPLKQQRIWRFFIEICVGLEYIHRNKILHRDIKTLNIFMNKGEELKIGDLGVAKMLTSNEFAQTMVGTPFYLSPELCEEKPYNEKSDVWALGCLLYELCTYRHPFEAQNQASLILKIIRGKYLPIPEFYSTELKELIDLCLERDYKRRPTTSNLLARPKVQQYYVQFGIDRIVEDYMAAVRKEKEKNPQGIVAKSVQQPKAPNKVVKALDEPKVKREEPKKQQPKRQQPKRQEIKKEEPKIILPPKPTPPQSSQKKIEMVRNNQQENLAQPRRQSKNQFVANLQRLIDDSNKKVAIKQGPSYAEVPQKDKPADRYQKIAAKVEQIKKDAKLPQSKTPNLQDKKFTPQLPEKKGPSSMDNIPSAKKQESYDKKPASKPPMPPPLPPSKEPQVIKVKPQKVVQAKVYDSQKNVAKPQGIIKSGGFGGNNQLLLEKAEKPTPHSSSKEKPIERNILSAKRPSASGLTRQEKVQSEQVKLLFGLLPSPPIQRKSQKNFKNVPGAIQQPIKAKNDVIPASNVSRVRKGGPNVLSRNARNASRYNQISKEEKDQVMNLPNKLNNRDNSSSDSQEEIGKRHVIQDLKAKTNKKFKLKDVDDELVLQKYEDLMKSQQETPATVPTGFDQEQEELQDQSEINKQLQQKINENIHQDRVRDDMPQQQEEIREDLQRNSGSDEQIEEMYDRQLNEDLEQEENLEEQCPGENYGTGQREEWSFDQEPQLPMLEQRQTPFSHQPTPQPQFQQNNPYLMQQPAAVEQTEQNKINYLQTKLSQNLKRQDEINKLMQIKLDECRKFITNEKAFQEILAFFRTKLNMEEEYGEEDEREIESFLKRKGLTDHRKFQNIYKIMHFEMELDNTRKIIQRICKRLTEFENK